MFDALVMGAGPAGVIIAASLCQRGLRVAGLAPHAPTAPWKNTYGIWYDELEGLGLSHLLRHRWASGWSYFASGAIPLRRPYGLIDKAAFQTHFLDIGAAHAMAWYQGVAVDIDHGDTHSWVTTDAGETLQARLLIDATGHHSSLLQRPSRSRAYQAAYGVVGRFSQPPVPLDSFVLMDYRSDHLSFKPETPTFLYGMDLGDGTYFVEETVLSSDPPMAFEQLEKRLQQRLEAAGVQITEVHEIERCLFPMTTPLPDLSQPVVGFGGSASMVHPASGYMVGGLLRRAPELADAIATTLATPSTPASAASAAWEALWSPDRLRKYYLYRFGLEKLMRFEEEQLKHFFDTFFSLPVDEWSGFLADTLTTPELVRAMINLFGKAPNDVRWGLMQFMGAEGSLLWRSLRL